jgi:methanethiol oxidase
MATTLLRPDPTFYPTARQAAEAPPETLAYLLTLDHTRKTPDALEVLDTDPSSRTYGQSIGRLEMPEPGDELHHFGWNACSSALCPWAPHAHVERRYLVIPGLRSSDVHIVDTKPDPRQPKLVKTITAEEIAKKAGYSRPHTVHCGPDGIYVSALGSPDGGGPGGIFVIDHESFEVKGRWEADRGPQQLAYDFWWHLGHDTLISSEWGTPKMVEDGLNGEILLSGGYGHQLHVWDLPSRKHRQVIDLGRENAMALELRPSHDPTNTYGFVGVVTNLNDLSASVWTWYEERGEWKVKKVITIPAEPADKEKLPPILQPFGAVPPLVTDINLDLQDRYLYVSCWGTGDFKQYDVSDPFNPRETASVRIGGIASGSDLNGGPQMVEVSRDGRRAYVSNSLYASWDEQFYPEGIRGWVKKLEVAEGGGLTVDEEFDPKTALRPHQIHLEGGDASSDSYCFPN